MTSLCMHAKTQKEHDERLEEVLTRLIRARITLNPEKCEFSSKQLKFVGHSLSAQGLDRSRQDCSYRKDGETAKCCRTTKIPGNDQPPTEVHRKPVGEHYASSRSSFKQERMALGLSSRRIFLLLEERNDPSASSLSLLLRERNYYICRPLVVWIRSSPLTSPRG